MITSSLLLWLGCCTIATYADLTLDLIHSWKYLEYSYNSAEEEADAVQSGNYYFRKNIPIDVEVVRDGRMFVTVQRTYGAPATLTTVTSEMGEGGGGPLLRPYPNWEWADIRDCDNLIAVYRVASDECNRLWVLDSGKVDNRIVCPPKLLAFDLDTDEMVERVEIPLELASNAKGEGLLVAPFIDTVGPNCSETDVYMVDTKGSGLVIYNGKMVWRVYSPYFEPAHNAEEFSVHGINFHLADGLFGVAITRDEPDVFKRLFYFRPLASFDMYQTRAVYLHLKKNQQANIDYYTEPANLPAQSAAQAFSSRGILFFNDVSAFSILCWNRNKPFTHENIVTVAEDEKTLQWASGLKVHAGSEGEELWVLTNRYQEVATDKLNFTKTNFRVLSGSVDELVRGTKCEL